MGCAGSGLEMGAGWQRGGECNDGIKIWGAMCVSGQCM